MYVRESLMKDYPYDSNKECMFSVYNRRKITLMSAVMNACSVYTRESLMKDYHMTSTMNACLMYVRELLMKDYPYDSNNDCMFSVYKGIPDERLPL